MTTVGPATSPVASSAASPAGSPAASPAPDLTGTVALVTGASRGFGRGISAALAGAGARVMGVARGRESLTEVEDELGDRFVSVLGDATDGALARDLLATYRPTLLVLCAGAVPAMGALPDQTWESFSHSWHHDTKHVFGWTREALRMPLAPGSRVITVSSGSALRGSPASGGYAGAKATVRFISSYAAHEAERAGLGITFTTLFPQLSPATDLGAVGVAWYAERQGVGVDTFLAGFGPALTPDRFGAAVLELATVADPPGLAEFVVSADGLQPVPRP